MKNITNADDLIDTKICLLEQLGKRMGNLYEVSNQLFEEDIDLSERERLDTLRNRYKRQCSALFFNIKDIDNQIGRQ